MTREQLLDQAIRNIPYIPWAARRAPDRLEDIILTPCLLFMGSRGIDVVRCEFNRLMQEAAE